MVLIVYQRSQSWTEEKARSNGVFLVHEMLDQAPVPSRAKRLSELQKHFSIDLALITLDEVERRVGRRVSPGEQIPHKASTKEAWYFFVFDDGKGALAAGPVNPASPTGVIPVGLILAIVLLPVIAGVVALRVERGLTKIERANEALALGELSVRVNNQHGPSNELAASFNAMAERVEHLIRSRDELIQAVSHELGSPLSRLRFHMELLGDQSDSQRLERLNAMACELDALDELVAELLDYVQSDELKLDRQAFDPARDLNDLAELARIEIPEDRSVEVTLDLQSGVSVFADQCLFQRVVENILKNAVRHSRGNILLELKKDEAHIRVAVHDDGPGIPEELYEKVMIPFFRIESDRTRKTGGAGLGLAIVSRIMHRHGGHLSIDRSPLGGATVETFWPRAG